MLTYEKFRKKPQVAKSLIGMSLVEFELFYVEFENTHEQRQQTGQKTRRGQKRQRGFGAGAKHKYNLRDRLLNDLVLVESLHHL